MFLAQKLLLFKWTGNTEFTEKGGLMSFLGLNLPLNQTSSNDGRTFLELL